MGLGFSSRECWVRLPATLPVGPHVWVCVCVCAGFSFTKLTDKRAVSQLTLFKTFAAMAAIYLFAGAFQPARTADNGVVHVPNYPVIEEGLRSLANYVSLTPLVCTQQNLEVHCIAS